MLQILILLFIAVPLIELALIFRIAGLIGPLPTLALIVLTGVLGAALTRYQGLRTLGRFRRSLAEGRLPHREMIEGILILLAGAVLLTPGILTDIVGFLLLVPPIRARVVDRLNARLQRNTTIVHPPPGPTTIDADFTVKNEPR